MTHFSDDDTWNRRRRHRRWMALMMSLVAILLLGVFMTFVAPFVALAGLGVFLRTSQAPVPYTPPPPVTAPATPE